MLRKSAMYNLTLSTGNAGSNPVTTNSGLLGVDPSGATPRTPEILNSLIAMTNPFDSYQQIDNQTPSNQGCMATRSRTASASTASSPTLMGQSVVGELNSPTGGSACSSPPSVQHTRSQLIKEGLKLTLQTKRRHVGRPSGARTASTSASASASAGDGSSAQDDDDDDSTSSKRSRKDELTIEDEERRRRRRERNKVAATKCRIKKREKTVNLVQESHVLESQNQDLKSQIQELEAQKTRLADMLRSHSTTCPHSAQVQDRHGTPPDPAVVTTPGEAGYPGYMGYPSTTQPQSVPPYMYSRAASTPSSDATSYDLMDSPNTFSYDNHGSTMYSPPCRTPSDVTEAPYTRFDLDLKYNRTDILKTEPYSSRTTMYYGVTKQEVGDDPLLSGLADGLDPLADPGFNQTDSHFCGPATPSEHFGSDGQSYCCRPTSLPLDTPPSSASLETPGSVCSPANFQYYGSGGPDCSYGLDNGCMA